MIDPTTRISRNPDVVFRSLEEEQGGVLLHLQSGSYHGLNQFGSLIWGLIENETRFAEILQVESNKWKELLKTLPQQK